LTENCTTHGCKPSSVGGVPADTAAQLNGAIGSIGAHVRDKPPWFRSHYVAIVARLSDVPAGTSPDLAITLPRLLRQVPGAQLVQQFLTFLTLAPVSIRGVTYQCSYDIDWFNNAQTDGRIVPCRSALRKKANVGVKPYPHWDSLAYLSRWQAGRVPQPAKRRPIHRRPHRVRITNSLSVRRKFSTPACRRFTRLTGKTADKPRLPNP
jgi:hypothetical protein